jgi:transcriptional regulator with XRE-family HTH domain
MSLACTLRLLALRAFCATFSFTPALSRARVSEILNRRRSLSMGMIRRLHAGLGIPAEVLIKPYEYERVA